MTDLALDLRFLRYAIVAAEQGSFRRAALALGVSQASVSRRVDLLEHRLGFNLFGRSPTGVVLTPAGERFISEAGRGLIHFDRAVQLAVSTNDGEVGTVHVAILASLNSGYLRDVLLRFRAKHPKIGVILHEATQQEIFHCLVLGNVDVSFATGVPKMPGCLAECLWAERVFVAMPSEHPLASREEIEWDDIRGEKFIVSAGGPGPEIHDYLVCRLAGLGFRPIVNIHQVGRESLLNLVALGYGLSLVSSSSLGGEVVGVALRPISGDRDILESSAVWSSRNTNPALQSLLAVARSLRAVVDRGAS
jgi:DNA-binding transcriptional LysR family regulator